MSPATGTPDAGAAGRPSPDAAPTAPLPAGPDDDAAAARTGDRRRRELAEHLAAAEAAFRGKNRLKQMAEAEAVLDLDRRHARANFLFGEALVRAGDTASGCPYLRKSRTAAAKALVTEAGCK